MSSTSQWAGVFPAVNVPMTPDGTPNEEEFRQHIAWLASFDIAGLAVNGHAGEVESLTPDERVDVIRWTRDVVGHELPVLSGVAGLNTREVVEAARNAEEAGASGLLTLPLPHFSFGAVDQPSLVVPYFEAVAEATSLPLVVFRYHEESGLRYSTKVLLEVARNVDSVVAIKDSSRDYEAAWTEFQYFDRKINLLVAMGSLFLTRFRTADGAISSFSNVVPDYLVDLFRLCKQGETAAAKELFGKIRELSHAIYGMVPLMQHWVVEKEALCARGRFSSPTCRPPFVPLTDDERALVKRAVQAAGLAE